jgi:hypothetical protein
VSNPPPAERLATILRCLSLALAARSGWAWLTLPLIAVIVGRLRGIGQRFARVAARIQAGRYAPRRRAAPRRQTAAERPRQANPLPQTFAWLLPLVPDAAGYGAQLQSLFRDPEMAALMQAAPASLGRPLRSLCRMLVVRPPPVIAPPERPRPQRATAAGAPKTTPPPERPCALPLWLRPPPGKKPWLPAGICGPPRPA